MIVQFLGNKLILFNSKTQNKYYSKIIWIARTGSFYLPIIVSYKLISLYVICLIHTTIYTEFVKYVSISSSIFFIGVRNEWFMFIFTPIEYINYPIFILILYPNFVLFSVLYGIEILVGILDSCYIPILNSINLERTI